MADSFLSREVAQPVLRKVGEIWKSVLKLRRRIEVGRDKGWREGLEQVL